ncbi:MAG: alpha-methylacyl-CoA racemase [Mycobacterium sp.]|uniref:CoA transferase n=1 Tax=Mycobacterium sp. TaxID=1785 RepID=UPI0028B2B9D5|nr:alpha-methylacyl-CoA racemase [Mycobacterium sp.]
MQPLCGIKVVEFGGVGPGPFAATALAELTDRLAAVLRTKTRAQWEAIFDGAQACATPVLTLDEAPLHPHHRARGAFHETERELCRRRSPRFSLDIESSSTPPRIDQVLRQWGRPQRRRCDTAPRPGRRRRTPSLV